MSNERRVAITGLGCLTPCGNSPEELWESLLAGRHGFELGCWFPEEPESRGVVAKVKNFDPSAVFDKKEIRRNDVIVQYAVYCAEQALRDAGTDLKDLDPYRVGCIIGSGIGGLCTTEEELINYRDKGSKRVSVFTITKMIGNMAAGEVAIRTGFKGSNFCVTTACASGTQSIGEAFRAIKHGYLDAALAGGTEHSDIGFCYAAFNNMKAITRSTDVDRASIPFDAERSGFVLGDGCGILVLEELEHAKARGARIYAEICGYGSTCDAYHETSPDPEGKGGAMAMELAVREAGIDPSEVNYINAHGTSTHMNDATETMAIKAAFGEHAKSIAVNSTKSMTGHLLGAAGGVEAVVTALSVKNGKVHKTLGYKVPDPECDLDYVTEGARELKINYALSNSLGFGGHNGCLCFRKAEG
ncbi:MAG: beta-ketoacyl-ACP synthase II [Lachnospiraceae bacterium]|nr:beta-ketoacyl-ACP synthase II [Ruminococcus sp.]MCM1274168.1 beta-ketoacyl-ACP synthase II [Lachnospiraceae bacterium]